MRCVGGGGRGGTSGKVMSERRKGRTMKKRDAAGGGVLLLLLLLLLNPRVLHRPWQNLLILPTLGIQDLCSNITMSQTPSSCICEAL